MSILKVILYSPINNQRIIYKDTNGIMTTDIEDAYFHRCHVRNFMPGGCRIEVCQKTRDALNTLVKKYDKATGSHIRKLSGFISKLPDGNCFYYFNEEKTSVVARKTAILCIKAIRQGMSWNANLHNMAFHYYLMMDIYFTYMSFGYDGIKVCVGEEEKSKRVCRFCGRRMPDVTFNNVAHAIQEGLGNKLLICNEECDSCNNDLSMTEDNFRYIMDFRRAMYHISRKKTTKVPTVVGKSFIVKAGSHGEPELFLMKEALPQSEVMKNQPFNMRLELKTPINNERMYKALCKMVIDILPKTELPHFVNTIKWIKYMDWTPDALPSILLALLPGAEFKEQPILDIFINNRQNKLDAPYCTAIIWIYDIAYMFAIPFVDTDGGKYKYDKNIQAHWELMKKLTRIDNWYIQDTSNHRLSTPWVDCIIDLTQKHIHVLPESDPVFAKCFEHRPKPSNIKEVQMPDLNYEDVKLYKIIGTSFKSHYNKSITDSDLMDVTQHIEGPTFILIPEEHRIRTIMSVNVNDTTDRILFYTFAYDIVFEIRIFKNYINIGHDYDGNPISFAFHYELRDVLFKCSLAVAESELRIRRKGTQFEKCSVCKIFNERTASHITYIVPSVDNNIYMRVSDRDIHRAGYED